RAPDAQRFGRRHERPHERVVGRTLDVDALYRDAALPGERERVRGELRRCCLEVCVSGDDHGRRVAELELDALAWCALLQLPADLAGARERDQLDALVL